MKITSVQKQTLLNAKQENDWCVRAHRKVMDNLVEKGLAKWTSGMGWQHGGIIELTSTGKVQRAYLIANSVSNEEVIQRIETAKKNFDKLHHVKMKEIDRMADEEVTQCVSEFDDEYGDECACKPARDVINGVCSACLLPLEGTVHSESGILLQDDPDDLLPDNLPLWDDE